MTEPRREIKTRDTKWAQALASFIATKTNITPNAISVMSVFCGLIAFVAYCGYVVPQMPQKLYFLLPIVAIIGIQSRLICNLIDGMVAIEGGKKSAVGGIYNEFPDRLSDTLIIVGAGVAGASWISLTLGLLAALFAMFTAYTRVLGGAIGANQYFIGPMAKQHRMALLTVVNLICIGSIRIPDINIYAYPIALAIIALGSLITVYRRVKHIADELRSNAVQEQETVNSAENPEQAQQV